MIGDARPNSIDRTGAVVGMLAMFCYFGAAVLPLPDTIGNLLGFAFGPLTIVAYIGIYSFWGKTHDGALLRTSSVFGVVYGAIVTCLIFIQVANNVWHSEAIAVAATTAEKETLSAIHTAVNRVQASLDVAFDVFVTASVILLGFVLLRDSLVSKFIGIFGILIAALLLFLNLYTFPNPPAASGFFDAGPFLGLWYCVFFGWMLLTVFGRRDSETDQQAGT